MWRTVWILALSVTAPGWSAFARAETEPANKSDLRVEELTSFPPSYGVHRPRGACLCRGKLGEKVELAKMAELRSRLSKGVACLASDFDGNGFLDFALLRQGWNEDSNAIGTTDVIVLMYGPDGWIRSVALPRRVSIFSFGLYRARGEAGRFGEPASETDGLVDWGEGGSTLVFLYKRGLFEVSAHASEDH